MISPKIPKWNTNCKALLYWTSPWMEGDRRKCNEVLHFPSLLHFCKLAKVMLSCKLFLPSIHCWYGQWVLLETLLQSGVTPTNHWRQDSYVLGFQLRDTSDFYRRLFICDGDRRVFDWTSILFGYFERRPHGKMNSWKDLGFLSLLSLSSLKRIF